MDGQHEDGARAPNAPNTGLRLQVPILDLSVERYAAYRVWRERWDDYVLLTNLYEKEKNIQAAMSRHSFSSDTRKVYLGLDLTALERNDPDTMLMKLEIFTKGIVNETLERHQFNSRKQDDGEKFDDYLTEVKILSTRFKTFLKRLFVEQCLIYM